MDHTPTDSDMLRWAEIDADTVQPRERAVPCSVCKTPTWHLAARCDQHYEIPDVVILAKRAAYKVVTS